MLNLSTISMPAERTFRLAATTVIVGLMATPAVPVAQAASSIFTGGIPVADGQTVSCRALATKKRLTNVLVRIRDADGILVASASCPTVEPLATCGVGTAITPGPVTASCEITSDRGSKTIRGTLINETTSVSSDAR